MPEPSPRPGHEVGVVVPVDVELGWTALGVVQLAAVVVHCDGLILAVVAEGVEPLEPNASLEVVTADGSGRIQLDPAAPTVQAWRLVLAPWRAPVGHGVWLSPLPEDSAIRLTAAWPAAEIVGSPVKLHAERWAAHVRKVVPLPPPAGARGAPGAPS